jgi:predicted nucleic acid-binding protein
MDAILAATALAHDLTVWTQDDDFEVLAELDPELRVHPGRR